MLFLLELLVLFFKNTEFLLQVIDFLCRSLLHGVHSLREDAHAFGGCLHFGFKQYAGFVGWLITNRRRTAASASADDGESVRIEVSFRQQLSRRLLSLHGW